MSDAAVESRDDLRLQVDRERALRQSQEGQATPDGDQETDADREGRNRETEPPQSGPGAPGLLPANEMSPAERLGLMRDRRVGASAPRLTLRRAMCRTFRPSRQVPCIDGKAGSNLICAAPPRTVASAESHRPAMGRKEDDMAEPLQTGDAAPDFRLPRDGGGELTLQSFAGKTLVLYFYPKDDTSGCTRQAIDFNALTTCLRRSRSRGRRRLARLSAQPRRL